MQSALCKILPEYTVNHKMECIYLQYTVTSGVKKYPIF